MITSLKIIYYSKESNTKQDDLKKVLNLIWRNTDTYTSIVDLVKRLRASFYDVIAVVLLLNTQDELFELIEFKDILINFPIVLILPDNNTKTMSKGYILRPRFISFISDSYSEIFQVLNGMINKEILKQNDHYKLKTMQKEEVKKI